MENGIYRLNLKQKKTFRAWLIEAGENKDYEDFAATVNVIGHAWGVARTKTVEEFSVFTKELFENFEKIKQGSYLWKGTWASKICFLISPEKYLLICDNQIRNCLWNIIDEYNFYTSGKTKFLNIRNAVEWQPIVKQYYEKVLGKPKSMYDEIDANLWLSNPITRESIPYISKQKVVKKIKTVPK